MPGDVLVSPASVLAPTAAPRGERGGDGALAMGFWGLEMENVGTGDAGSGDERCGYQGWRMRVPGMG